MNTKNTVAGVMCAMAFTGWTGAHEAQDTGLTLEGRVHVLEAAVTAHSRDLRDQRHDTADARKEIRDLQAWAEAQKIPLAIAKSRWYGTWEGWFTDSIGTPNYLKVSVGENGIDVWLNSVKMENERPLAFESGRMTFTAARRSFWLEHAEDRSWLGDRQGRMKVRATWGNRGDASVAYLKRTRGKIGGPAPPVPVCCSAGKHARTLGGEGGTIY